LIDIILFIVLVAIGVMLDIFFYVPLRVQTWTLSVAILVLLIRALRGQRQIAGKEEAIMAEIDDLKSAVTDEQAAITDLTTEVDAAIAKITSPGVSAADVESAAQSIATANASIRASAQKIKDALNPPPPPA
jgi:uncharacterized protein YlxW (UPF0749 family)